MTAVPVVDALVDVAIVWLGLLAVVTLIMAVRAGSMTSRLLAVDVFTLAVVGLLLVAAYREDSTHYLDAAIVVALVAFVGTLRLARHLQDQGRRG